MKYHVSAFPNTGVRNGNGDISVFAISNNELVIPRKVYLKEDYPTLPYDMVKITGKDGTRILIPKHKLECCV